MTPSARLLRLAGYGLVFAALPVMIDSRLWLVPTGLWAMTAVLLVIDAASLWRAVPRLDVSLPPRVGVGDDVKATVQIHPRTRRTTLLRLRAQTRGSLEHGEDLAMAAVGRPMSRTMPLRAPRRGDAELAAVWVQASGRLGLLHHVARVPLGLPARVMPSMTAVNRLAQLPRIGSTHAGSLTTRRHGSGTEFDELKVYAPGMDARAIDWKASARHRELRVRRFRVEQSQRLIIAVDTGRRMLDPIAGLSRLDHAIHTSLAIARVALNEGDLVAMQAFGTSPQAWVPPGRGTRHFGRLTHATASLEASPRESNPLHAVRELVGRVSRRSMVVLVTDLRDPTSAEGLAEALRTLARSHVVVVVTLVDPCNDPWSDPAGAPGNSLPEPRTPLDVARTVVREDLRRDSVRAMQIVRMSGVQVVAAPPNIAASAVLRRYLRRAGRTS